MWVWVKDARFVCIYFCPVFEWLNRRPSKKKDMTSNSKIMRGKQEEVWGTRRKIDVWWFYPSFFSFSRRRREEEEEKWRVIPFAHLPLPLIIITGIKRGHRERREKNVFSFNMISRCTQSEVLTCIMSCRCWWYGGQEERRGERSQETREEGTDTWADALGALFFIGRQALNKE